MTSQPPADPLTFLFTDVEGSTRLWETHPDAMPEALTEHFRLLERAIKDEGGTIVKETGDGIFAVFPTPSSAINATVSGQRSLGSASWGATGPLKVRMGIHTGRAVREHEDYHGTDVNRTARLMATAHGGQVVVSEATYSLVQRIAPNAVSFVDLGEHRLKDLARPDRIFQVQHPALSAEFPPLRSLGTFPNNLPAALSSFIGRQAELAAVEDLLARSRLVTLTGAGGSGKTRLALQVAADRVERHSDGVWLVDLAGLVEPDLVAQTVVSALRVPPQTGRPAIEALTHHLASRDLLIVLDNCEHVIAPAAELADAVLRAAADVRVIATSREPLNVPGEVVWRVPSLSIPHDGADAEDSEAVTLFVERATSVDPGFSLTPERAAVIVTIARRLDGLPLAIELAAARVRALSVEEIAARLRDRFALLTGGARTALPRQRTLEAAVAWSYDLLDDKERVLFARLSVFAGTFDLEAVQAVAVGHGIGPDEILDLVPRLVDKSLVSVVRLGSETRYRLLETLRDYARNQLSRAAEVQEIRDAHLGWAIASAEIAGRRLQSPDQDRVIETIATSMDDLRAALSHALETGDPEAGLRLMGGLEAWWTSLAAREARHWLEQLLAEEGRISPGVLGRGLSLYGVVLAIHGEEERGAEVQARALALLREAGDERAVGWSMHYLAIARWQLDTPDAVKRLSLEALATFERLREPIGIGRSLWWLVLWELEFGTIEAALAYGSRLQELASHAPGPLLHAHVAEAVGLLARVQGDLEEAGRQLREAVVLHARIRNYGCLSHCLEHVALWSLDRQEPELAATLLGTVDAIREDVVGSVAVPSFERIWHDRGTSGVRQALEPEAFEEAWGRGRAMNVDEAIATGLAAVA